jgi:predicted phage tail protein
MKTAIQKNIMRRVYYSYALSIATSAALWQGFLLGACIALFGKFTHVASIARNFSHTNVENAPAFIFNAFANALAGGEVLTVLVSVFMIGLSLSFVYKAAAAISAVRLQTA